MCVKAIEFQTLSTHDRGKMYIDPGSKKFVTLFVIVILGTIGFFVASIFIDFKGDTIQKINFEKSNFHFDIKKQKSDKSYVIQVFRGELKNYLIAS